ncbi:hypothetical protein [Actinoplanes italicus]|uniref:Uncharacterized protein n=1 Tax=Actinoplanes italicus TaxID=113567 RepID=A0A2T0J8N2_9ACTN|nr:hypothetical protein [Actinoplanes italicus]PRX04035.1 hypothetical protein CLV67_1508 [Actinoplanes italicus]
MSTGDAPPRTGGATRSLTIGIIGAIAGVAVIAAAFGVDQENTGWVVLVAAGSVLLFLGFFAANAGLQRLRARRAAVRTGPHDWAGVVAVAPTFLVLRLFAVNELGSHVYSVGSRHVRTLRWTETSKAIGMPVEVRGRARPGLTIEGEDDEPVTRWPAVGRVGSPRRTSMPPLPVAW